MTIVRILQFHAPSSFAAESEASEALAALKGVKTPQNFMLGTQVRDEGVAQLTSEWLELAKEASPEAESYINGVKIALGSPAAMSHITLQQPAFGPLTFPVVEFVQPFILSSTVTPSFRGKIEADFEKFESLCFSTDTKGHGRMAYGWVLEEQEHEDVKGIRRYVSLWTGGGRVWGILNI